MCSVCPRPRALTVRPGAALVQKQVSSQNLSSVAFSFLSLGVGWGGMMDGWNKKSKKKKDFWGEDVVLWKS